VAKIVVPTANTTITSIWGKSVADALNAIHVQAGTLSYTTDGTGLIWLTYPEPFLSPPFVVVTNTQDFGRMYSVVGVTATYCSIRCYRGDTGGSLGAGVPEVVNWIAAGPRA
jgi:hypothetical protein